MKQLIKAYTLWFLPCEMSSPVDSDYERYRTVYQNAVCISCFGNPSQ